MKHLSKSLSSLKKIWCISAAVGNQNFQQRNCIKVSFSSKISHISLSKGMSGKKMHTKQITLCIHKLCSTLQNNVMRGGVRPKGEKKGKEAVFQFQLPI